MICLRVDSAAPDRRVLKRAADIVSAGGIAAFPTDTLYGLAVDPRQDAAVNALFTIKGREPGQPIPLIAADCDQVERCIGPLPELGRRLAGQLWPGPLTLVFEAAPRLAAVLHSSTGRVAVRVPAHPIAQGLAALVGHAVTSTSANRSGQPAPATAAEVIASLGGAVDVVLDGGPAPGGPPSTVVDVTGPVPVLLRVGAVPWERVLESLHQT